MTGKGRPVAEGYSGGRATQYDKETRPVAEGYSGRRATQHDNAGGVEPAIGFEPMACGLRNRCSTPELRWPSLM